MLERMNAALRQQLIVAKEHEFRERRGADFLMEYFQANVQNASANANADVRAGGE